MVLGGLLWLLPLSDAIRAMPAATAPRPIMTKTVLSPSCAARTPAGLPGANGASVLAASALLLRRAAAVNRA